VFFFSLRIFRIRHEKLSEGCIHGSAKRSSQTGHRNYQAEKGGYAISYSSGKKAYIHKITCSPSKFGGFLSVVYVELNIIFFGKKDFEDALQEVRPSVSSNELGTYDEWNKQFGSLSL
jgi:SpoVK/Ycf46/Vps4 family AAA+-type ATPase